MLGLPEPRRTVVGDEHQGRPLPVVGVVRSFALPLPRQVRRGLPQGPRDLLGRAFKSFDAVHLPVELLYSPEIGPALREGPATDDGDGGVEAAASSPLGLVPVVVVILERSPGEAHVTATEEAQLLGDPGGGRGRDQRVAAVVVPLAGVVVGTRPCRGLARTATRSGRSQSPLPPALPPPRRHRVPRVVVPAHHRDPRDLAAAAAPRLDPDLLRDLRNPLDDGDGLVAKVADKGQDVCPEGSHRGRVGAGPGAVDVSHHGDADDSSRPVGAGQEVEEPGRLGRG